MKWRLIEHDGYVRVIRRRRFKLGAIVEALVRSRLTGRRHSVEARRSASPP